ncbi:MAG: DUF1015 domain-containing protein [Cyclobacteriaceae bacterium]
MAEIKAFRAWRYNDDLTRNIEQLTSPLFDVVSDKQRESLYHNPFNSIHISVPNGERPALNGKKILQKWKETGVLMRDQIPGIYVYYQYFTLPGDSREHCRKGFVCNIRAYEWEENTILRHENTMPRSVEDRRGLLEHLKMDVSPTHGLYTDSKCTIEKYLDESMQNPIYETEDYQGVRDVLSVINDYAVIKKIMAVLSDKQVILADGHHRYEGTLSYIRQQREKNPQHTGNQAWNYHLMYLTNTETADLRILPTHRLVAGLDGFDENSFLGKLEEYFTIEPVDNPEDVYELILGKQWAFGVLAGNSAYRIRLKPDRFEGMTWKFPDMVKELDLTVMHYFIFAKVLGIRGEAQRTSPHFSYERNFATCCRMVLTGEAQVAIITQDLSLETVKKVCYSGFTLPQKSTYFYPKVICGYLFGSIDEKEQNEEIDSCF